MSPIQGLKRIARERSRASVRDFWRDHKGFIAWIVLTIVAAGASIQSYYAAHTAQEGVNEINEERAARVNTQSSINAFFCEANNKQNGVLGKLIAISLRGVPANAVLNRQQRKELRIFREVGRQLSEPTNCRQLALELAKATGINPSEIKITPLLGIAVGNNKHRHTGRHHHLEGARSTGAAVAESSPEQAQAEPTPHPSVGSPTTGAGDHQHQHHPSHHPTTPQPNPGESEPPLTPPAAGTPPGPAAPPASPEQGGAESPSSGGNSNSLKVCAVQPLLKKCIEAEVQL